jgi:epoxyqueuosine reductase
VAFASRTIKELGAAAGFDLVGISPATPLRADRARYLEWLEAGRQGSMAWMTAERAMASTDPTALVAEARSVISIGLSYWSGHRPPEAPNSGKIARYAWGRDYHRVMGSRLDRMVGALQKRFGGEHKWCVDTAPALDRALAARSGLGWVGKNSNVLSEKFGSFVLLGEIITTLEIEPDEPLERDCGSCKLCVIACPTRAIGPDRSIDSRKCISYLTIEHRGSIPHEYRPLMGNWVFGCDICQDVCPPTMRPHLQSIEERRAWAADVRRQVNSAEKSGRVDSSRRLDAVGGHPLFHDGVRPAIDLVWLLHLTHDEYLEAFRDTSIKRAKVWMLRRNAAVALGNVGTAEVIPAVTQAMRDDEHPLVRGHAAWALGRLGDRHGAENVGPVLVGAMRDEEDTAVREEMAGALANLVRKGGSPTL